MTKRKEVFLYSILVVYFLLLLYFAVISRNPTSRRVVWMDLLGGYIHPRYNSVSNGLLNICSFVPIGVLVGLIAEKYRIGKAMLAGFLVSVVIEFSQLIWRRGVFDVDDFLNDLIGAFVGCVLVVLVTSFRNKASKKASLIQN